MYEHEGVIPSRLSILVENRVEQCQLSTGLATVFLLECCEKDGWLQSWISGGFYL